MRGYISTRSVYFFKSRKIRRWDWKLLEIGFFPFLLKILDFEVLLGTLGSIPSLAVEELLFGNEDPHLCDASISAAEK